MLLILDFYFSFKTIPILTMNTLIYSVRGDRLHRTKFQFFQQTSPSKNSSENGPHHFIKNEFQHQVGCFQIQLSLQMGSPDDFDLYRESLDRSDVETLLKQKQDFINFLCLLSVVLGLHFGCFMSKFCFFSVCRISNCLTVLTKPS